MRILNNHQHYGLIAKFLHWSIAIITLFLFGLGLWLVELDYYDTWYQRAPRLHEGMGTIVFLLLLARLVWRWISIQPEPLITHRQWEKKAAHLIHVLLNILLLSITISGYLIVTAKGDVLNVFNLFSIPASLSGLPNQADKAGEIHLLLAWGLMLLVGGHALAALKHHIIDKDKTLNRMLGK